MKKIFFTILFLLPLVSYGAFPDSSVKSPAFFGIADTPVTPTRIKLGNGWSGTADGVNLFFESQTGNATFYFSSYTDSNYSTGAIQHINAYSMVQFSGDKYIDFAGYSAPVVFEPGRYYEMIMFNSNLGEAGAVGGVNSLFATAKYKNNAPINFTPYMLWVGTSTTPGTDNASDTISFAFPAQSSTVHLFSPWLLRVTGVNLLDTYRVDVVWNASKIGTSTPFSFDTSRASTIYKTGAQLLEYGAKVPRIDWGYDFAENVKINAYATLYNTQDPDNPLATLAYPRKTASATTTFTLLNIPNGDGDYEIPYFSSGTSAVATSTVPVGSQENPQFTNGQGCAEFLEDGQTPMFTEVSVFGFANVNWPTTSFPAGAMCAIGTWIDTFIASTGRYGAGTIDTVKEKVNLIFPLSIRTALMSDIAQAEENAQNVGAITIVGHGSVLPGREITLLSSSTTNWIRDRAGFDIRGFISKLLYLFTAGMVIMSSIVAIKTFSSSGDSQYE